MDNLTHSLFGATLARTPLGYPVHEIDADWMEGFVAERYDAVRRYLVNSSGRALIKTGQSCNISVPLTAVLYDPGGTVVQVVRRDRVETRRVTVGQITNGQAEIREGLAIGDVVVARAGSFVRDGDRVRSVTAAEPQPQ